MSTLFIDSSFIAYSKMFVCRKEKTSEEGYGMWKYYYTNDIFKYIRKFEDIDEVIIARDSKSNWRRDVFPYYKKHRKVSRTRDQEKTDAKEHWFNWGEFYDIQEEFINTLKESLPLKVLEVNGAEADDIVAILCREIKGDKYIVTSDHDYIQMLQYDDNIKIW